ncbi:PH domain protein [Aspergillus violaceofuscus CBS 115571]|uniref:PH domain protein n=1 Tax=Aspergillus violaceofuscus (strain CBS 115571) TaxID=1450538 RepID=A0A2V5H3P3_ASPV1|nr:PH domain protein [Aspergillus violaceofuscus CBS 115571]
MGRSRVLSLMSVFGGSSRKDNPSQHHRTASASVTLNHPPFRNDPPTPDTTSPVDASPISGTSNAERRISSRPDSTYFSHNPPLLEFSQDTPPELQPIFGHLNSHANKLYHEGYFLKLNDLDTHGRPCSDRQWVECYAQLVGTALSLWDAAALDEAGEEGDVRPTFINLADASIKMLETLPTRNQEVQSLKNILSICSAGQNRYLLHFNSFHSLTQWTAAIRLALFEHTSLYEAYTGSIIAGKGKTLNNVKHILERNRFKHEDWARVRFGAGTPWKRCWFVVTPPNEKEFQKAQKSIKKSAYDRAPRLVTGHIKFYETKKTKKATPIATITDAYAAYAIYPQSKPLIDQSTLVKIEGRVTVHSQPETTSEGFVFVMPEVHPAVSGFEMMLRFLIPTFDTFNLYGRPTRLLAATNHIKSIMFAFPNRRRYGYLDILDISSLMQTPGSQNWSEAEWRRQLKEATSRRMATAGSRTSSISGSKPRFRSSLPSRQGGNVRAGPNQRITTPPENRPGYNQSTDAIVREGPESDPISPVHHARGASDFAGLASQAQVHVSLSDSSPPSSSHELPPNGERARDSDRSSAEGERNHHADPAAEAVGQQFRPVSPPSPVAQPPAFTHGPGEVPHTRPRPSSDLRKVNNRMSDATLTQLVAASGGLSSLGPDVPAENRATTRDSNEPSPITPSSESIEHYADWVNPEAIRSHDSQPAPPTRPRSGAFGPPLAIPKARGLRLDTTKAVKRKPVPQQYAGEPDSSSMTGEPSFDDLRHTVNEEALNWVGSRQLSFTSRETGNRQDEGSIYDDESAASPDYASTKGSVYSKRSVKSIPRPRMGVMKTVGTVPDKKDYVIGDAHYALEQPLEPNPDIPTVDFGPTMTLMPTTARPNTSETYKKSGHERSDSNVTEKQGPPHHMERSHSRSPSMMWQPGMAAPRPTTPGRLTPEQFVQQRSAPSPPAHVHHRTLSSSATAKLAPALPRPLSGEWASGSRQQPHPSAHREGPARPHSRGASTVMNYNELSSHLSAREQEHVSRMTGAPLLDFSGGHKPQVTPVNPMGLVGAIDAREREKKIIRDGVSNQMVQHAIAQRQQHWQQQQQPPSQPMPAQLQAQPYGQDSHYSVYNLPAASRTWDALNQPYYPEEPRRQSWYGQYFAAQKSRTPPVHHHTQSLGQPTGYFSNANASHY